MGFFIVLVILTMKNSQVIMPIESLLYNAFLVGTVCGLFFSFIQLIFCIVSNVDDVSTHHNTDSSTNYYSDNKSDNSFSSNTNEGCSSSDGGCDNN